MKRSLQVIVLQPIFQVNDWDQLKELKKTIVAGILRLGVNFKWPLWRLVSQRLGSVSVSEQQTVFEFISGFEGETTSLLCGFHRAWHYRPSTKMSSSSTSSRVVAAMWSTGLSISHMTSFLSIIHMQNQLRINECILPFFLQLHVY